MNKWIRKLTRTSRRSLACATAAALALSAFATAPSAQAAGKKKPTLNAKKKTLYWNKSGKKNYTLKIKKNKTKSVVATTWKTSKKSIVALSKKKDTSVRLTAKKKGTATITATVKYVPQGKWQIKTAKLTCKVTSKGPAASTPNPTEVPEPTQTPLPVITATPPAIPPQSTDTMKPEQTPGSEESAKPGETPGSEESVKPGETPGSEESAKPGETPGSEESVKPGETPGSEESVKPGETPGSEESVKPDGTEKPSTEPEQTPGSDLAVSEVVLSETEALLGMSEGRNTIRLTAVVKDGDGNLVENSDISWGSDDEDVAVVDGGVVKAVQGGMANITASVDGVTSMPCAVTVDDQKPLIERAELSSYKAFAVYFNEPVMGEPTVSVKSGDMVLECDSPSLSEDGKSMIVSCKDSLSAGNYKLVVNGLYDLAGNEMDPDASVIVNKKTSEITGFVCKTEQVPAGLTSFDVYFSIVDQYGEKYDSLGVGTLTATAQTENGMPFRTQVKQAEGYVRVTGSPSAFTEGRKIKISLTYQNITKEMIVTLVNAADMGKAVKIAGLSAVSEKMENKGTAEEPAFQLTGKEEENVFVLSAKLLDKFEYEAKPSDVIYMIEDESVLAFSGSDAGSGGISTSANGVSVRALKGGKTTITAYLASDDSESFSITVTVKSTDLQTITVANLDPGINGKMTDAKVTLSPDGTGLTEADLQYRVTAGDDHLENIEFVQEKDGIYINITAKPDGQGKEAPIKFIVYSKDGIESKEITYISEPLLTTNSIEIKEFGGNAVTADSKASTTYKLLNRFGEDITKRTEKQPSAQSSASSVISGVEVGTGEMAGTLTITSLNQGKAEIILSMEDNPDISKTISVTVVEKAYVKKIEFGTPSYEEGLILGDDDQIIYVPVFAKDQYGNEYTEFTTDVCTTEGLQVTAGGKAIDDDSPIKVEWCKKTGTQYDEAVANTDIISAISIQWNNYNSTPAVSNAAISASETITYPAAGETIVLSCKSGRSDFQADTCSIAVNAESNIVRMELKADCQAAVRGADVTNAVTLFDQYGKPQKVPDGQGLKVQIAEKESRSNVTSVPSPTANTIQSNDDSSYAVTVATKNDTNFLEAGEYIVQVYMCSSSEQSPSFDSATFKGSYTLVVGEADDMIQDIKVSDIAKTGSPGTDFLLENQYADISNAGTGLTFECKLYTGYKGRQMEVAYTYGNNNSQVSVIPNNQLVWKVDGPATVDAKKGTTSGTFTFKEKTSVEDGGPVVDDKMKVSVSYIPNDGSSVRMSEEKLVKVSNKPSEPQGEYRIVTYTDLSYGKEDLRDTVLGISKKTEFAVIADDQYGKEYKDAKLFSVVSSNSNVKVEMEVNSISSHFTLEFGSDAGDSDTAVITVHMSKLQSFTFTVKKVTSVS